MPDDSRSLDRRHDLLVLGFSGHLAGSSGTQDGTHGVGGREDILLRWELPETHMNLVFKRVGPAIMRAGAELTP